MIRTIGKMANAIHNSDLNNELFGKVNLSDIIIDFCKDTNDLDDIDIKFLFDDPDYLKEKINKHFTELKKFIIRMIKPVFPDNYKWEVEDIYYDLTKMISDNSSIYMSAFLSGLMGSEKIELNFNLKPIYADSKILKYYTNFINIFKYIIIYPLLTGMCIAKLIFIEKKIRKLDQNNEFYRIVFNMAKELKDIDLIIEKTRPLYNEFYKDVLDFIDDDILYRIAITMMVNKISTDKQINNSNGILDSGDTKSCTIKSLDKMMNTWLYEISKNNKDLVGDIGLYITYKIIHSINTSDLDLYIKALSKIHDYTKLYYKFIEHNRIVSTKERYLNGDFSDEKEKINVQYSLNNIISGQDFELFLTELFKKLGYKATHTGKAGDQGADLVLEKGNYTYAVQAKFYTGKLGNTPVQEVVASLKYYNAKQGVVITNSTFTDGAYNLAKANSVILIDGNSLNKLIGCISSMDKQIDILPQFNVHV